MIYYEKYDGYDHRFKFEIEGKCIYANGDIYEGEWKDDKRNG